MSRWMPNGEPTWDDLCAETTTLRARCEAAEADAKAKDDTFNEISLAYSKVNGLANERLATLAEDRAEHKADLDYLEAALTHSTNRASALEAALRDAHKSLGAGGVLSLLRDGRCDDADQMIVATIEAMRAALEGEKP